MALLIDFVDDAGVAHTQAYCRIAEPVARKDTAGVWRVALQLWKYKDEAARDAGAARLEAAELRAFMLPYDLEAASGNVVAEMYAALKAHLESLGYTVADA